MIMMFMALATRLIVVSPGEGGQVLNRWEWCNRNTPTMIVNTVDDRFVAKIFLPTEQNKGYQTTKEGCNYLDTWKCILKTPPNDQETYLIEYNSRTCWGYNRFLL